MNGDYAVGLITKISDYDFKIVKFKGNFVRHSHYETEEMFTILEGALAMNFRDQEVEVHAGEMIVIPKESSISHFLLMDTKPSS